MKVKKKDMTQDLLLKYLVYNKTNGHFTWARKHCSKVVKGSRAGGVSKKYGHRVIHLFGSLYPEHRIAWLAHYGEWPTGHIDHVNHNETDNRISNLRDVSQQKNNMNSSLRKDNTTGHVGVWINKNKFKKYTAEIHLYGKKEYKSFYSLSEAIAQRKKWEREFGFHKNHGIKKPMQTSTTIRRRSTL